MRLSRMWTLRGHPGAEGLENAETEATLREALAEPAAPGEDESYRRLMAVIADDMRLRQPAPQRPAWASWGWIPAMSGATTVAILLVLAYTAGVDHGVTLSGRVETPPPGPSVATNDPVVPHGKYNPPPARPSEPAQPESPTRPRIAAHPAPQPSPMNYIGNIMLTGLSKEQRDLVRLYSEQVRANDWENAARTLEDLADIDPMADVAVQALHGAAEIYRSKLENDAEALRLYQREVDLCDKQIGATSAPERQAVLEKQQELAQTSISALSENPPAPK